MRLIIAGSRSIRDEKWVHAKLDAITKNTRDEIEAVLSGTATGPDTHGENWAIIHRLPLERYPAKWQEHGRPAGMMRNTLMSRNATHLIAFWDGKSRGTKHMIDEARKRDLTVRIVRSDR